MLAVLTDKGTSLPALDLRGARELGLSLLVGGRPVDPESLRGALEGEVELALGPLVLRVPEEGLEYDLAPALERRLGGRAKGDGPMAPSQRVRLELEDPLREPAIWETRLFALFRALKELERALPKERDPLRRLGLKRRYLGLWDEGEPSLTLELDTPLAPFFLHLLDRFLEEGKRPPARRGEQALFLSERGYGVGRVRRVEGGEAHLLVEGPATLVLPREEVVVLPRSFPVLLGWGGTEKLGKLLERRYDHFVERLEGAGFREVEILTFAAPFQVEAHDPEGRRVYFRERGGDASLALVALPGLSSLQAFRRGLYAEVFWPTPLDSGDPEETATAFLAL
ncbi:hypothetical protein TTHNP4_00481 (plasmid) [Thermus thermophilus]|uniref:Uncharacterized protein n=1 Tax=Thermus thermophilus TaxID=274 RepID=A0A3P4AV90_THETH|nr:hypothetical protein [Thermus thermophilus]VCU55017.1 hypothetical protein TTHNP4_00481 [Thermus thermophilus]